MMRTLPELDGVQYLEYADDVTLYVTGENEQEVASRTQRAINSFHEWTKLWGFQLNYNKTRAMKFTLKKQTHTKLVIGNKEIEFVKYHKYLGMTFDAPKLGWGPHIMQIKQNTIKSTNIIRSISNANWGADKIMLSRLYKMLVRSRIDYGSMFYDTAANKYLKKIDTTQNNCLRKILGV